MKLPLKQGKSDDANELMDADGVVICVFIDPDMHKASEAARGFMNAVNLVHDVRKEIGALPAGATLSSGRLYVRAAGVLNVLERIK